MQIDKILYNLLLDYECVIVPNFGGFIVRESPCNFNTSQDTLKPYSKTVFFNQHLQDNDGLLINAIVSQTNASYTSATTQVEQWINRLNATISDIGKAPIAQIVNFYKGNDNGKWFTPDSGLNLALSTYGLRPIKNISVAQTTELEHTETIHRLEPVMHIDQSPIETLDRPKTNRKAWLVAASIALVAHIGYLGIESLSSGKSNNQTANTISVIDAKVDTEQVKPEAELTTPSVTETVQTEVTPAPVETPVVESPAIIVEAPVKETVIETPQAPVQSEVPAETPVSEIAKTTVAAKYRMEQNAQNHQKDLIKKNIQCYVQMNAAGLYEVIITE